MGVAYPNHADENHNKRCSVTFEVRTRKKNNWPQFSNQEGYFIGSIAALTLEWKCKKFQATWGLFAKAMKASYTWKRLCDCRGRKRSRRRSSLKLTTVCTKFGIRNNRDIKGRRWWCESLQTMLAITTTCQEKSQDFSDSSCCNFQQFWGQVWYTLNFKGLYFLYLLFSTFLRRGNHGSPGAHLGGGGTPNPFDPPFKTNK